MITQTPEHEKRKGNIMKSLKERIAVEQACLDGEVIVYSDQGEADGYSRTIDITEVIFHWDLYDYRIKSKPMEIWVNIYENGMYGHKTKAQAVAGINTKCKNVRTIKFIEVIE